MRDIYLPLSKVKTMQNIGNIFLQYLSASSVHFLFDL